MLTKVQKSIRAITTFIIYLLLGLTASHAYALDVENKVAIIKPVEVVVEKVEEEKSQEYDHEEVQKAIDDASLEAKKNAADARKSLREANKIVRKSNSTQLVEVAKNRAIIEQSRKDIAKMQLLLTENIKKNNEDLDKISLLLADIENQYLHNSLSLDVLKELYVEVVLQWRMLVDKSLKIFTQKDSDFDIEIPNPRDLVYQLPKDLKDQKLIEDYNESVVFLKKEYDAILNLQIDLHHSNKNYQSNLLLRSGGMRSNILQKILYLEEDFIQYDNDYVSDLVRELKLIPYRPLAIFYSKTLKYKQTIDSGFVGLVSILKQVAFLGLLILILLISKKALTKLTNLFNEFSEFCVTQSISIKSYEITALLLSKIAPYFKWLVLLFIFFLADIVLENTFFEELGVLIPYFQYYFLYKIFRIFAHFNLNNLIDRNLENPADRHNFNKKIRITTKSIGIYLLGSVFILYLTQSVVRKAYFYNLTLSFFVIGLVLVLAITTSYWKTEIQKIVSNRFPEKFSAFVNQLLLTKVRSIVFSLAIMCVLIAQALLYQIVDFLRRYDFFKNLLSQIYHKRLESAAKRVDYEQDDVVSDSYSTEFSKLSDKQEFIKIADHPYRDITDIIENWKLGKSDESSIAIHGEKGVGKTRFVEQLALGNDIEVMQVTFDGKITNKEEFLETITGLFNEEIKIVNLFKFLASYDKKTIIILDDCHNLFLSKEDGFETLKTFLNFLVKIDNPNLLWVSTFGTFSWNYLQSALKIDRYFRYILRLPRWSDTNIRDLIIHKHDRTGFKLTYDPLIFAMNTKKSAKEFEDLQFKFFQIIWSQSRGNPTIAIFLWLSSIHQTHARSIKVSLPKVSNASHLLSLLDEHLFVYGAIIKHGNLTVREAADILSISKEEVINIVRIGLEKGYLIEYVGMNSGKRFTISPEWQLDMNKLLINRNILYAK